MCLVVSLGCGDLSFDVLALRLSKKSLVPTEKFVPATVLIIREKFFLFGGRGVRRRLCACLE